MWHTLSDPLGQRVAWALIHFAWQGAAVAALAALLLRTRWAQSPQRRYVLCVAALAAMALCPLATGVLIETRQSVITPPALETDLSLMVAIDPAPLRESPGALTPAAINWQPYLLTAWLAGVVLFGCRLLAGYCGTLWLRGGRTALPSGLRGRVVDLSRRLGLSAAGRVYASPRVREALVVGLWRPIVLLPLAWLTELPPDVLDAVIAHELAHVRRWDRWVVLVQRTVETLLFYHPAVWWVSRRVALERELCCDELAVLATGGRLAYARALETVGQRSLRDLPLVFATPFQGEPQMNLLHRVRHVLGLGSPREAGIAWPAGVLALTLSAGMACWSLSAVLAADQEKPKAAREGEVRKEGEARKEVSPEAAAAKRKSPEAEAARRKSPEAEAAARKSPEAEAAKRKLGLAPREGEARDPAPLEGFRPQTEREAALYKLVLMLREEVAQLRREVGQMRQRDGNAPAKAGARDGDVRKPGPRDGEGVKPGPRDGDAPVKKGPRDGDAPVKKGPRDGDAPAKPGPRDGDKAPR